jgi:1,4-dihydroxy-2-naphthoyl-CoA hydrolase
MSKLRPHVTREALNDRAKGHLPGFLGVEILAVNQGSLASRMGVSKHHFAPNGFLHAASVVALADTTCGFGTVAHLPEGARSFTTIELKTNFLGTVRDGAIACVANAKHLGRTPMSGTPKLRTKRPGAQIALFRCTQMILWPEPGARLIGRPLFKSRCPAP